MPRRMPKPHDALRADAIAQAYAIIEGEGVTALTVRRLAERIGCSIGSIYNLFDGLDDLTHHVTVRLFDELQTALNHPPLPDDPRACAHQFAQRYLHFVLERPHLTDLLLSVEYGGVQRSQRLKDVIERVLNEAHDALERSLHAVPHEQRADAVAALWAGIHGIARMGQGQMSAPERARTARRLWLLVDMVLEGSDGARDSIRSTTHASVRPFVDAP